MAEGTLTFKEALEVAINEEIKAYNLYTGLRKKVKNSATQAMLTELAHQELGHRKLLEEVVRAERYDQLGENVPAESQGIADFLVVDDIGDTATPQEVMIFAIKAEVKAYNFYHDFTKYFKGTALEALFQSLAAEEQRHKTRLEDEYETHFMRDN